MDKQSIFDRVARHLLTQNRRSVCGSQCAYRGAGGAMCAIGCLISEEDYRASMEGSSANVLCSYYPHLPSFFEKERLLLSALQSVHDCFPPETWRRVLIGVAEHYRLDPSVLK